MPEDRYDALIFDLDGTLVHTTVDFRLMKRKLYEVFIEEGIPAYLLDESETMSRSLARIRQYVIENGDAGDMERVGAAVTRSMNGTEMEGVSGTTAIEGALECLRSLQEKGITPMIAPAQDGVIPAFLYMMLSSGILGPDGFDQIRTGERKFTDPDVLEAAIGLALRYDELLYLLADVVDSQEGVAPGTSRRVQEHAARFAAALGLPPEDHLALTRAALLRGIGMLKVPVDVRFKKEMLTYDEWALLQAHPKLGADMVANMDALKDTGPVIRTHHECYDGTGYPDGLEGEHIPRLGRMMKILDVYCAMTSPRHYREGHATHEQAVKHLKSERGKHFDPELVDVFVKTGVGQTPEG